MRADRLVMLGVVGFGLFAVVELVFASPRPGGLEPAPIPPPDPSVRPRLPQDQGNKTKAGQAYWGRFDFAAGKAPHEDDLKEILFDLGFDWTVIYSSREQAAKAIPNIPLVLESATSGTRWFYGKGRKTASYDRPPSLTYVWIST